MSSLINQSSQPLSSLDTLMAAASSGSAFDVNDAIHALDRPDRVLDVDIDGMNALMVACHEGNMSAIKPLLAAGINIDALDYEANTALQIALRCGHNHVAACLLEFGAKESNDNQSFLGSR